MQLQPSNTPSDKSCSMPPDSHRQKPKLMVSFSHIEVVPEPTQTTSREGLVSDPCHQEMSHNIIIVNVSSEWST